MTARLLVACVLLPLVLFQGCPPNSFKLHLPNSTSSAPPAGGQFFLEQPRLPWIYRWSIIQRKEGSSLYALYDAS
jgi:hypothetical protein